MHVDNEFGSAFKTILSLQLTMTNEGVFWLGAFMDS